LLLVAALAFGFPYFLRRRGGDLAGIAAAQGELSTQARHSDQA
jgi:hypothetical protein